MNPDSKDPKPMNSIVNNLDSPLLEHSTSYESPLAEELFRVGRAFYSSLSHLGLAATNWELASYEAATRTAVVFGRN